MIGIDHTGQRSLYISCTLRIPTSLTRLPPRLPYATPTLLAAPKTAASGPAIGAGAGAGASAGRSMSIPDLQLPQSLVQTANGTSAPSAVDSGNATPSQGEANGGAAMVATGEVNTNANAAPSVSVSVPPPAAAASAATTLSRARGTGGAGAKKETHREIKCCFSVTIRRDAWGVPVAIMGQWIVRAPLPLPLFGLFAPANQMRDCNGRVGFS